MFNATQNFVSFMIVGISDVSGGDEELEGVVFVHIQLPGLYLLLQLLHTLLPEQQQTLNYFLLR